MRRSTFCSVPLLVFTALSAGCSSETFSRSNDFDAVLTVKDKEYDYGKNKSYAVVDELKDLSDFAESPIEIEHIDEWESVILEQIHKNMKALGYEEETGAIEDADVVVAAGVVAAESWQFYSYYPWWGWYGYWYSYPWYGGWTVGVDFSSGSVVLVMIDPDRKISTDELTGDTGLDGDAGVDGGAPEEIYQAIWGAGIHGLLNYVTEPKVKNGIDQAFDQSPYLKVGGDK